MGQTVNHGSDAFFSGTSHWKKELFQFTERILWPNKLKQPGLKTNARSDKNKNGSQYSIWTKSDGVSSGLRLNGSKNLGGLCKKSENLLRVALELTPYPNLIKII